MSPDPRLRILMAIVWAIGFFLAAVGLWMRRPAVRLFIPTLLLLYALYQLGLLGLYAVASDLREQFLVVAALYAAAILITIWALNRNAGKRYFRRDE